ncbi:MAG TPA: sigma factor-like helix-turn-helix DNA-binding protein [Polyangiaceae bacterium]|nr:sigma factor-like helix-turn-helix DNA-binding protein [Polyangiaceae bacterium]
MHLTARSQLVTQLLPVIRAGISPVCLRAAYADEALQETLIALVPQIDLLAGLPEHRRRAYAFTVASRTAMAVRRRVGLENARASSAEVYAWECSVIRRSVTPEEILRATQGADAAEGILREMSTRDRNVVLAINEDGLPEREVARKLGMTHGEVAYRLRRARAALARAWVETTSWMTRKRRS